jgi:peptide/nickel transport system substrate-binding protein
MRDARKSVWILGVLVLAVTMASPSAAVTVNSVADSTAAGDSVLRIGISDKVDSLNPNVGMTRAAYTFYSLAYSGLFSLDEDMNIIGDLAIEWEIDSGFDPYGSVWRYDLTRHAKWHDGNDFTADDVVFTINLNANNYTMMWANQAYAYYIDYAEKVDDYTVRIHYYDRATESPMPVSFGDALLMPILPAHLLGNYTPAEIGFAWEGVFEESDPPVVGTGPFMVTEDVYDEFLQDERITLLRNPEYHGIFETDRDIRYDGLEIHCFSEPDEMSEALMNGMIDLARYDVPEFSAWRGVLEGNITDGLEIVEVPSCAQHLKVLDFDMRPSVGNPVRLDPAVRQAMAMAVNKSEVVSSPSMLNGYAAEGSTLISSANEEWHCEMSEEELFDYDIQEANAVLEAAGYEFTPESPDVRVATASSWAVQQGLVLEGTNLTFELVCRRDPPEQRGIAEYIAGQWGQIGIGIELRTSIYTYSSLCPEYAYYEIMIWDFWGRPPDPHVSLFTQSKDAWNGWNDNTYFNADYEAHYNETVTELDDDARREHVLECQRVHYADLGYMILAEMNSAFALRTDSFVGWGDWSAHPGRSVDNFWGASALYFDLEPVNDGSRGTVSTMLVIAGFIVLACAVAAVVVLKRLR